MITADLRRVLAAASGTRPGIDPGLRPTGVPGQYAASLALALGGDPRATAAGLAAIVAAESWIATAEVTGPGYLTITVTTEALAALPARVAAVGSACATSNALHGITVAAPPASDPLAADTWEKARAALAAQLTASLAAAAGATVATLADTERTRLTPSARQPAAGGEATDRSSVAEAARPVGWRSHRARTGEHEESSPREAEAARPVGWRSHRARTGGYGGSSPREATAFAGTDAVRFALARVAPGTPVRIDPRKIARQVPGNPAYAVRYAHARAASGVRWAATTQEADTIGMGALPRCLTADPEVLALLGALSWLPERVAIAARRGRPDEFARYLEELASATIAALVKPDHPGTARAPGTGRLALARAARAGLAAGLGLLGIGAPDRLLPGNTDHRSSSVSRVAHPAGPRHGDVLPADHPPAPPADLNEVHPTVWPHGARRVDGVLALGGIDVRDLAAEYGTPVLITDEADVRMRCNQYVTAFGEGAQVAYAAKAFCSRAVLRWVTDEGLGVDVCTSGELAVALAAGVDPALITMHGNNKLPAEIERAVAVGVGHVVIDSFEEIARIAYYAELAGVRQRVLVRVTTGVEAHTHEFMATAHDDQKFGFSLASGAADEAVRRVLALPPLEFAGLHSHIGSQIFDTGGFEVAAHRVLELAARIHAEHGVAVEELDLGGGFGIAYVPDDDAPEVKTLASGLRGIVATQCAAFGLPEPRLTIEPGRSIIGPSTVTLYEVGTIKDVDGIRSYVSVDGGMSDNIRTALYDAEYTCVLASRASDAPPMLCRVVGRHCESGDIVVKDCYLPADLAPGDLLAVAATGAYCRSLASNYNHLPRPGVVAVCDGAAREIVRRETLDDLLRLDVG